MKSCGGSYSPETRRKYFISGPQWAAAYQGQALFHAPTRPAIGFEEVIRKYAEIGIGYWATHDTDVIPTEAIGKDAQWEIVRAHREKLCATTASNVRWSQPKLSITPSGPPVPPPNRPTFASTPSSGCRTRWISGTKLGAGFAVYWPGSLGYYVQGAIEETATLRWYAGAINAACDRDIEVAAKKGRPTLKHCLEAKPFEPQAEILLPT